MANNQYDIFLSFRGKDTRCSFTGSLYHALSRKGFKTFMDSEGLNCGDQVSPTLLKAIQHSRISIVVFSKNYASSKWCLDELVEIVECMRLKNQLVWPIFFKVAPSDVRHQRKSYAEAMAEHEERFGDGSDKVQKWRSALSEVANLKGWHYKTGYEFELIEEIVKKASTRLRREHQLDVGEHMIGHQSRIEEVKSLLDIGSYQTVCMLGIHGIGGMGKTTLAKALYNSFFHQFECAIFLEDVREHSNSYMGLVRLQEAILSNLFEGEDIKLGSVSEGVTRLKDILQCRRVLLVLDDVDSVYQLEKLAGSCSWFGSGSKIIITTRDKHVLDFHRVEKRYEMEGLNDDEALQLFCWKAFKMSQPPINYTEVSNHVVHYASGLPLALKVIGSHLATKSVKGCEDALKQYEKIPEKMIQDILKISYDCLEDNAKYIFLDIACFFKGKSLEYVENVWEKCDFFPSYNVGLLVDKSLITIKNGCLLMHDLIQEMGREIIRLEAPSNPGERSRLYLHQDVLKVLRENSGSSKIEGIVLDSPKEEEVRWSRIAFEKMNSLRILIVRNTYFTQGPSHLPSSLRLLEWDGYPSKSLPSDFHPHDIVDLSLRCSLLSLEEAKPFLKLLHLTRIDFSGCQYITHFPDISGVPNLTELRLDYCGNLIAIHHSVGFLEKLQILKARECIMLQDFPPRMQLPSLQYLDLSDTGTVFSPHIEERMCVPPLRMHNFRCRFKEVQESASNHLMGLEMIQIHSRSVTPGGLPSEVFMLPNMTRLFLEGCGLAVGESLTRLQNSHVPATTAGCSTLNKPRYSPLTEIHCSECCLIDEDLHIILSCFPGLEILVVPGNGFVSLPTSIKGCANLRLLDVNACPILEEIPELPISIEEVYADGCSSLTSEAFKTLWSQTLNEAYGLQVVMPRTTEIPYWFDHQCKGKIVSFWARRKFPVLAGAFLLEQNARITNILLYINGDHCEVGYSPSAVRRVSIFDLRCLFSSEKWPILDNFLLHEWNYVEIRCKCECECEHECECELCYHGGRCNVNNGGVYVYKRATNMEDILFTCPNPLKRTLSIVDDDPQKRKRDEEAQA